MRTPEQDPIDPLLAAFRALPVEDQREVHRQQAELLSAGDFAHRYSTVPSGASQLLRELVNIIIHKPALDKHKPGIGVMDAKYILLEVLPKLLPHYSGETLDAVRRVLEEAVRPRTDIDTPEDHCVYYHGRIMSALALIGAE